MKPIFLFTLLLGLCFSCIKTSVPDGNPAPSDYDLSAEINKKIDSIGLISAHIIENPEGLEALQYNDSLNLAISFITDHVIAELVGAYGKTETDTILSILKSLDNSGYIPNGLYSQLTEKDFSTVIGQQARAAYQGYLAAMDALENSLQGIDLWSDELVLIRLEEGDTILIRELLAEHQGYKVLDFWATWCAPCRAFNRNFQAQYEKYNNKGLAFYGIGIRIDNEREKTKFLTAVKNDNTPWAQFIDVGNGTYGQFNTNTVPFQVLLDENNRIIKILSHDMEKDLDEVL